jgi:riboflavin synthase
LAQEVTAGDSVAVQGACLTVLTHTGQSLEFRLMDETLQRTNLGKLRIGSGVNLERPVAAGERFDGHFVMGHVDATCTVRAIQKLGGDKIFTFTLPADLSPYLIGKGSVTLDGVSLTVVKIFDGEFTVSMMPYTLEHTTFGKTAAGDAVNIEVDMIGKYVVAALRNAQAPMTNVQ